MTIMKRYSVTVVMLAILTIAMCSEMQAARSPSPMSRYHVIYARYPFGKEPSKAVIIEKKETAPVVTTREMKFAEHMSVVYIRRSGDGFRVGIYDKKTKSTMILDLNETDNATGITLLEADYDNQTAKIKKGRVEATVYAAGSKTRSQSSVYAGSRKALRTKTPQLPTTRLTYSQRAKLRAERNKKLLDGAGKPSSFESKEALEDHLLDYQMNLIRAGGDNGPPLPVPLTPEADAQLVSEGHLPPLE